MTRGHGLGTSVLAGQRMTMGSSPWLSIDEGSATAVELLQRILSRAPGVRVRGADTGR